MAMRCDKFSSKQHRRLLEPSERMTVVAKDIYIVEPPGAAPPGGNKVYAEAMGQARPARAVVPVPALHYGYLIEIDAVAVRGEGKAA